MAKKISFKEFMDLSDVKRDMCELTSVIEDDALAMKMIAAARTVEDLYDISKRFIHMSFTNFQKLFREASAYFSSDKTKLSNDILDDVVGGAMGNELFLSDDKKISCLCGCVLGGALVLGDPMIVPVATPLGTPLVIDGIN